ALSAERKGYHFEVENKTVSGMITHSLFSSLQEQSIPLELGAKMSDIFAWDIDFFTDLRKYDYYRVIYEEKTRFDGLKKIGSIIAAEFNTQGKSHYAFLFENEEGFCDYFDDNGKSLRKQLLKAPLSYTRISSSFSRRRYHPILHHYAPHLGLDYAAPMGTPVMSTGDGVVIKASRTRANGNYIKIRHNQNYITYYLHLSRFAKAIKYGAKIKQGQVIGYVGSTGYSTGPHLDYRVKRNGRFVNPRSIKLPPAKPVSETNMASFLELRELYLTQLQEIPIEDQRTEHYAKSGRSTSQGKVAGETPPAQPSTSH
ncbi:MAG: M23 family metallopeptidase, partial [Candidatus Krumholzibacteria bacterium]|nr:M23 family metallopeptidase [Candidatus Krumholzibacteria bacterium]